MSAYIDIPLAPASAPFDTEHSIQYFYTPTYTPTSTPIPR